MKLQSIYKEDINRNINGVIKADQNDEQNLQSEFQEYIITKELRRHFADFLNIYENSIDIPTDNIGVWISGFFGSGKSHFLKMISYLLSNPYIAEKKAVDYFEDKFDDPLAFAQLKHCASVPTESILFNIDVKSSVNKDKTAILRVFAKVFYEHLGYFGASIKVARFEQFLDKRGVFKEFKQKFEEYNGMPWEESRDVFEVWEDDITNAMADVLNVDKDAALKWFNASSDELSIDILVDDIKSYIDSKGKDNRLIFCIDEVGQYITEGEIDLLFNLQSVVEELGTKCHGRVWVIVTAQEEIDSYTKVKASDFSKIQDRFKTHISLTSSSVDEVIKKRILAKNENGEELLKQKYNTSASVLKNLISFNDTRADMKGYSGEKEFIETYPFIPFQFNLFQNVLIKIRQKGNTGAHQSSGERSMLSGFQEVAQRLNDRDENALVPFYLFYDTVNSFLESTIRQVIERCDRAAQSGDGIEDYDVKVLKLLYLIKYIDDIPANVDNIATLMTDDIETDKIELRNKVKDSLARLLSQNYISKNGLTYSFLTDDEQDVAREIKNTMVDSSRIIYQISSTVFDDLFSNKVIKYGNNTIGFDQAVDDTIHGAVSNSIRLRIITAASDLHTADSSTFIMQSKANNEAICVLSDDYGYYDTLESALKIRNYTKTRNINMLAENIQNIIRGKSSQASAYEKEAKELISKAIINGEFYIAGEKVSVSGTSVKDKFSNALTVLIESVYTKMNYVTYNYKDIADVLKIFNSNQMSFDVGNANAQAVDDMALWLEGKHMRKMTTCASNLLKKYKGIPYGFNELDIVGILCQLIRDKKVNVVYAGSVVTERDSRLIDLLRKKSEIDKTVIERRIELDERIKKNVKSFLGEYLDIMDVPDDEDELLTFTISKLEEKKKECDEAINRFYVGTNYPGRDDLMRASTNLRETLSYKKDAVALFNRILKDQDVLLDNREDCEDVFNFLKVQKSAFDKGVDELNKLRDDEFYLTESEEITKNVAALNSIISMQKPYRRIAEIPNIINSIEESYKIILDDKKESLIHLLEDSAKEVVDIANGDESLLSFKSANSNFSILRNRIDDIKTLSKADAVKSQINETKQRAVNSIFNEISQKANNENEQSDEVKIKVASVSRNKLVPAIRLKSADEIEKYTEMIKKSLLKELEDNDFIQII